MSTARMASVYNWPIICPTRYQSDHHRYLYCTQPMARAWHFSKVTESDIMHVAPSVLRHRSAQIVQI
jgi:hypothetical protein